MRVFLCLSCISDSCRLLVAAANMHELREGATTDESRFRDSRIASFLSINALLDMVKK